MVTVAEVAAAEQPGLAERLTLPSGNATNEAFRTFARKMLEQGQAERELLAKHGLADKLLEDLETAVDDFDASVVESNQGRRAQRGVALEPQVPDHPQYTMWKARHDAELAAARDRAARRAERDGLQPEWHQAWRNYQDHWREGLLRGVPWRPRWWDLRSWLQFLLGKDRHR